jgi:probable F420-dependent oxidoreductase
MLVEVGLLTHPFHENPVWPDLATMARTAREAEDRGFDGILVPEAGGHDPFLPILVAAQNTSRVRLRTGVAVAFPRSPLVMAQTAWDLARYSDGRFELGLGTQVRGQNERRYAAPWTGSPGPRLREYVLTMQAMWHTFEHPDRPRWFEGEHYRFTLMPEFFNPGPIPHPHVPVYLAAVNRSLSRTAGELADGIFPHPICTPRYIRERMLPYVAEGLAHAGRPAGAVKVLVSPMVATGRNKEEVARKKVYLKQRLAFYASTRLYHAPLELHGFLDTGKRLFELSIEQRWREMTATVGEEMFDTFAVAGVYDEIGPRLEERWGGLADIVHLDLPPELRAEAKLTRSLIDALH